MAWMQNWRENQPDMWGNETRGRNVREWERCIVGLVGNALLWLLCLSARVGNQTSLSLSLFPALCLERSLQHADSRNVCMRVSVCAATLYTQQLAGSEWVWLACIVNVFLAMSCIVVHWWRTDINSSGKQESPPPRTYAHAHTPVFGLGRRFISLKWVSRWLILWKEFGQWGRLEGRRRVRGGKEGVPTNKPWGKEREREEEQMDEWWTE